MKNTAVAACFIVIVVVWLGAQPATSLQAPLSGLPPVSYALGPDSEPQPGVPKGALTKHVLAPGKFYTGTPHDLPGRQRVCGQ
jgi:hypothetical protein